MTGMEQLFDETCSREFFFLETTGYRKCSPRDYDEKSRDAHRRIRYFNNSSVIDVDLRVGLGLFVYLRLLSELNSESRCEANHFVTSINIEQMPCDVELPKVLRVRGSKTLYGAYNHSSLVYQRVIRKNLGIAIAYLAQRLKAVEPSFRQDR